MAMLLCLLSLVGGSQALLWQNGPRSFHRLHFMSAHSLEGKQIAGPLEPLGNFVLVKVREAKAQTLGGIVLPDQSKEKPTEGIVVAVGPGKMHPDTEVHLPMPVAVGQRVLYGKYDGSKVRCTHLLSNGICNKPFNDVLHQVDYDGSEHTLIRDDDVLLVYSTNDMTLSSVEPVWDRILVKVAKSNEATLSGIVVAPTSGGGSKASEGEVRMRSCL